MLYDPITKGLLTKYGGLSMTGYYEMANRMVLQLRSLLVAATQVLFPAIAELNEKNSETIYSLYKNSYRILLYIALPFFSAIVAFTPIISHLWIGYYEGSFILFSVVLSFSWFFNTLVGPAYFANLGIGELAWNTVGSVLTAVLNLVLGVILGGLWGGIAVVIAWVLSLITGNLVTLVSYHRKNKIPVSDFFPRENIGIGLASVAVLAISLLVYRLLIDKLSLLGISGVTVFATMAIIAFPLWQHPMRKRLVEACLNR
jgi:O-antigen/teichoic acid export membrane protein